MELLLRLILIKLQGEVLKAFDVCFSSVTTVCVMFPGSIKIYDLPLLLYTLLMFIACMEI